MLGSVDELEGLGSVFLWSLVLVLLILGAFGGVVWLRRRVMREDDPTGGAGFSLTALREIYKQGQMSSEEFEKAKAKLLEAMSKGKEKDDKG
jgi:uncharacterized membrane protein